MGFLENLHVLMVTHDLTGEAIARIAGVTPGAVSQWRKQRTKPRDETIDRICSYFDLERDQLTSDHYGLASDRSDVKLNNSTTQIIRSERELTLLLIYRSLNEEGRSRLCNYADDLSASGKYQRKKLEGE